MVSIFLQSLRSGDKPDGAVLVAKLLKSWPKNWHDCVAKARLQFEKFFNHKVFYYCRMSVCMYEV